MSVSVCHFCVTSVSLCLQLAEVYDSVETDLTLLGVTAIEDTLQPEVKETLVALRKAGIKVGGVITGDMFQMWTLIDTSDLCHRLQVFTIVPCLLSMSIDTGDLCHACGC